VRYRIDTNASKVVVKARSSIHDTKAKYDKLSGTIDADRANLNGATASIKLDMTSFDAGDFLKNRKLRKDLDVKKHPEAAFELTGLENVEDKDGSVAATAMGILYWRGHEAEVRATGTASITDSSITADATFELNVRDLGVTPPKILMIKVEDIVTVDVSLVARAG
jgi:polyisoprenoid-binding protein YceI